MLEKLRIEFTKSRAYRTTDNALVEGKNGAVIRKHIGYGAITAPHAEAFQKFYTAQLNPYLNYHRLVWFRDDPRPAAGPTPAPIPGGGLSHSVRKAGLAAEVGSALEAGHHHADASTASPA